MQKLHTAYRKLHTKNYSSQGLSLTHILVEFGEVIDCNTSISGARKIMVSAIGIVSPAPKVILSLAL
ncbi:MAG: hypothetical protein AAGK97_06145, partial [Bacteroidota bacterium]